MVFAWSCAQTTAALTTRKRCRDITVRSFRAPICGHIWRIDMSKHIIVCPDGTGNTAVKGRGTNVFKLFEAVDLNGHRSDPTLTVQIGIYDDGVGTERFKPLKIFAGATGFGLARNVRHLYKALVRVYDEGDRIFLFGFSRGAFTVRTLAGMIVNCGILANDRLPTAGALDSAVRQAYRVYRQRYRTKLARSLGLG